MSRSWRATAAASVAGAAVLALGAATPSGPVGRSSAVGTTRDAVAPGAGTPDRSALPDVAALADVPSTARPLAGKVVVVDPGHQQGNARHLRQTNRLVDAGGFRKACNSTGTEIDDGYSEASFTMSVAASVARDLRAQGAQVHLTRTTNSARLWGPCVDERGRLGNTVHADAVVSVHADGTAADRRGFFVIRPALRRGWTDDVYASSRVLGREVHDGLASMGLPNASYDGGDGYDERSDLGTLNWSDVPVVMVELGNMRNAVDARHMTSATWREDVYASGLSHGIAGFLTRGSPAPP